MTDLAIRDLTDIEIDAVVGGGFLRDLLDAAIDAYRSTANLIELVVDNIEINITSAFADLTIFSYKSGTTEVVVGHVRIGVNCP